MGEISKKELMAKIKALGAISKEQRNAIVCSLIGHSKIATYCFGYQYCARCEAQIGDCLGSVGASDLVYVGHNCDECQANYKKLDWRHKLYAPSPFKTDEEAAA